MDRIFAIGDIHGCHHTLEELLARIQPRAGRDRIVFLGDYINRGPSSKKVVDRIISIKKSFPGTITLMGNHEQILLSSLAGGKMDFFLKMGGEQTLASYSLAIHESDKILSKLPPDHLDFFQNLVLLWNTDKYTFVHAGLEPGVHLSQQTAPWCCWARREFINSDFDFGKKIVFGHTPFSKPLTAHDKIGIDTGAVYGGHLTCLVLPDQEFITVKCKDKPIWPEPINQTPLN